jgi:hypothetical protein
LRLVYADWLDDHGLADRARLIRLEQELARCRDQDPHRTDRDAELTAAARSIDADWLALWRHLTARKSGPATVAAGKALDG